MAENLVGDNPGGNLGGNPGGNLGGNPQPIIPERWVAPVLEKAKAVKLVLFSIEKLTKHNVRDWVNQMQTFLKMQDCWRIIELTEELKDNPERMGILFEARSWEIANLKAIHYILGNIVQKD